VCWSEEEAHEFPVCVWRGLFPGVLGQLWEVGFSSREGSELEINCGSENSCSHACVPLVRKPGLYHCPVVLKTHLPICGLCFHTSGKLW
jgi:hypothetical protein